MRAADSVMGQHHGIAYPGQTGERRFDLAQFDTEAANLHLVVDTPDVLDIAIRLEPVLETLPASMAFLCPNVNSYRRFGSQFYVPNAPSWGLDNRTVALRVPTGSPDAVRLEHATATTSAASSCLRSRASTSPTPRR